ncbi:Agenet-like domain-containing protein [Methylorubrum aminovorans]
MSAAETAALSASGDDRKTGESGLISTTNSTAVSIERKGGAADAKASVPGTAGITAAKPESRLPPAAALNAPRPGDRTFVGEAMPRDPAEIGLGSVVLAQEGLDEGWWEAEVIGINGRVFSLRWRDYPTQPTILRKATELALLPPGEA